MLENILNKLKSINIDNNYFLENFSSFLDDLNYVLVKLPDDYKKLPMKEQFLNSHKIGDKVTNYYINLIKKYMKFIYNMDINIKYDNTATMAGGFGGYSLDDDCIYVSEFFSGFRIDTLQTLCHEAGHKRQKEFRIINSFEELIKYPPYMIILLKEVVSVKELEKNDIDFYRNNYNLMYFEQEANSFSFELLKNMLANLYRKYIEYTKNNNIQVSNDLLGKLNVIQSKINELLLYKKKKLINTGHFNLDLMNELSGYGAINSKVTFNGNETDRLVLYDKCIKENPILQNDYPVLKLLFNGDRPKTYQEIICDMSFYLKKYPEFQDKIKKIYYAIIKSAPLLYISHIVQNGNVSLLKEFLSNHEEIFIEYSDEINKIVNTCNNDLIIELLQRKVK